MPKSPRQKMSPRERQILDILYRRGHGTVADVRSAMSDPPSYDAVRTTLRILENKGAARHRQDGPRYVYLPVTPQKVARRNALRHIVDTFFEGSAERAAMALLRESDLSDDEIGKLEDLIGTVEEK